ncbi:MAG: UvrD-helicase domain-containing protein [Clostridia bacterium]|nr:UvrD-helicase domain-containing protein [Clostridia bacterium]
MEFRERFLKAKRALFDTVYEGLNAAQREAIYAVNGPLLVLAGAGSGKTTVLVKRIAHIIRYGNAYHSTAMPADISEAEVTALEGARGYDREMIASILERYTENAPPAWAILAITFTNKAANEMKERLAKELAVEVGSLDVWAGTFHSVCVRILRRFGEEIGLSRNFTIYDTDDQKRVIKDVLKELNIDDKMFPPKAVLPVISRAKDTLTTPVEFAASIGNDYRMKQIAKIYAAYQERLEAASAVDFDDIIMKTVMLLRDVEEVRSFYQRRFRYVLIDEYQDTNGAQFELSRLLSDYHRNLMVVGDDDQSIYKFRGATIENILGFDKTFEDSRVIKLEQNYRSTQIILDAANAVIENNESRHGKKLWTAKRGGDRIVLAEVDDQNAEGVYVAEKVLQLVRLEGRKYSDFAVLYRMNAQSNAIEKILARSGVPYRVLGGTRFYERKEIKDIMAYLCLINNPDDDLRLKRIINEPKRKIGATTLTAIEDIATEERISMLSVCERASSYTALLRTASRLTEFASLIAEFRELSEVVPLSDLFRQVIERTGYRQMLIAEGEESRERLENVEELISNAVEYETNNDSASLSGFLEEVALVSDVDNYDKDADAVVMMTMHSAKGLEFPVVFLPGMENGMFPSMSALTEHEEMEEERRLAYVAITRAKEKLFLTHAKERLLYGQTQFNPLSRFVKEIPPLLLDKKDERQAPRARVSGGGYVPQIIGGIGGKKAPEKPKVPIEIFSVGARVKHGTFGDGTVLSVRNLGSDTLYEVMFDTVGTKKLMGNMAKLKKVE